VSERHTHRTAAETNASLAAKLEAAGGSWLVWVPTFIFYALVQVIEARLADHNEHHGEHSDRMAAVYHLASSAAGPAGYRKLQKLSCDWRYRGTVPAGGDLTDAKRWAQDVAASIREPLPDPL